MAKEMNIGALQANLRLIDKKSELAFERTKMEGTLTDDQERFSKLISDETFMDGFFAADSVEEVQALFKANGLDISTREINVFGKHIFDVSKKLIENGGELSEEELAMVAGGGMAGGAVGGHVAGAATGSLICPGIGTAIGAAIGFVEGDIAGLFGGMAGGCGITVGTMKSGKWFKNLS